jgi:uncharacterized protein YqgC (DUF456 family)
MMTSALGNFLIVLAIGIVAGLVVNRYSRSWFARQVGSSTRSDLTAALVGIAGAFVGYHLSIIAGLAGTSVVPYVAAIAGALLVLWGWRGR